MGRKPLITEQENRNIERAFREHPDDKASVIWDIANEYSGRQLSKHIVNRELAKLRAKRKQSGGKNEKLDIPWSLGSLLEYPIYDSNKVKLITEIVDNLKQKKNVLLVRHALWIARLSAIPPKDGVDIGGDYHLRLLYLVAVVYGFLEVYAKEALGLDHLDTTPFDGPTLEDIANNYVEFTKKIPRMPKLPELENLLKDGDK